MALSYIAKREESGDNCCLVTHLKGAETSAKRAAHHSRRIRLEVQGHVPDKGNITCASALTLLHDLAVRITTWNDY